MASILRRSLLVVWIPPLVGLLLTGRLLMLMATFSSPAAAWQIAVAASFALSLGPSLTWWTLMESAWRWGGEKIRSGWTAMLGGGLLGGLLAFATSSLLVHNSRARFQDAAAFFISGLACGLLLGRLVFPPSRWSKRERCAEAHPSVQGIGLFGAMLVVGAAVFGSALVLAAGIMVARAIEFHLPSDDYARRVFTEHREAFNRMVALLGNDRGARFISGEGGVNPQPPLGRGRIVPQYQRLLKEIGAKAVLVGEDGTVEFQMWGSGGAIMSDSYKGIRYAGNVSWTGRSGWMPTIVQSLDDDQLPHDKGGVVSGLYILPIDQNWSIYRFEYQE